MKANAPEKVYLHLTTGSHILNGKYYEYKPAKIRVDDKIIEYTRTDAFIKKALDYIENNIYDHYYGNEYGICSGYVKKEEFIKNFKNYIKGE